MSKIPQDVVAIFHASFHPTQGNVVDWSLKASDDLDLSRVEFSALPSGLHLVEQDVVFFTKGNHRGVCIFRRRATNEHGHRGFRLSSMGILLTPSSRPRPWRHVAALKELVSTIYGAMDVRGHLDPIDEDWEPARRFFEERQVRRLDLSGAGEWKGWSNELDGPDSELSPSEPTLHLPHLLRLMGASCLTLYKHVLGRRRILIFTLPPVEAACNFCQVAADMCYDDQIEPEPPSSDAGPSGLPRPPTPQNGRLAGKHKEGIKVLGMVTLHDILKLEEESKDGRGWIACTTDALFLERPQYYDLVIDLTTSTPAKATRPALHISRPRLQSDPKVPSHKLSTVRFTWSDVKLWTELDRLLQLDAIEASLHGTHTCGAPPPKSAPAWTDAWRIYEDMCLVCAGLWMGTWRTNSPLSYSSAGGNWGSVHLEGDDDLSVGGTYMRSLGSGIEGRPAAEPTARAMRRSSGMSLWSLPGRSSRAEGSNVSHASTTPDSVTGLMAKDREGEAEDARAAKNRQVLTTLALLQTFHGNTAFLLARLKTYLPPPNAAENVVVLTPKDLATFELCSLSSMDARFVEWLALEYGGGAVATVRKSWKDLFGLLFGYGSL